MTEPSLSGCRVFVAEDDPLIVMIIEDILDDENCVVVGPFRTLDEAIKDARVTAIDLALLDVSLGDEKVYPVAEILSERKIPFLLLSGYGPDGVPADRLEWPWCAKPFSTSQLIQRMRALREGS